MREDIIKSYFKDDAHNRMLKEAVDRNDIDAVNALLRVLGSQNNWCSDNTCGPCPIRIEGCRNHIHKHISKFIKEYYDEE